MNVTELSDLLAAHPFFEGLDPAYIALIAGCGKNVAFREGEMMFRQGEPADLFFLIRHGTVALELHHPTRGGIVIETVHEGEVVGWSWLVPPHVWKFDGRAAKTVRAVALDGACLRRKAAADDRLAHDLYRRFTHRMADALEATRLRLLDVYGN